MSVVVDFGAHGAPGVRGCVPLGPQESLSGVDALVAAGLSVEGTAQWGTAFICRVDGRPGAEEDITLPDGQTLRESCARTPSQQAYWSLWHSSWHTDGTEWRYATTGASDLDLVAGDAVALVFTTGLEAATAPAVLPAQARSGDLPSGWTDRAPAAVPPVEGLDASAPDAGSADSDSADGAGGTQAGTFDAGTSDAGTPDAGAPDASSPAPPTGSGTLGETMTATSTATSTGVGLVPLAALVLVLLGGAGAAVVARRRR